jgi:hypothetical protein
MYKEVKNLRILVAGGDGSVGWVLTYLDKLSFDPFPAVRQRRNCSVEIVLEILLEINVNTVASDYNRMLQY